MNRKFHTILYLILGISGFSFVLLKPSVTLAAQSSPNLTDAELAEKYAPVLYFHQDEIFRPQPVEVLVDQARLRISRRFWFDLTLLNEVTLPDLLTYNGESVFLDVWYGTAGESDYKNYSAHRDYYRENLSPSNGGLPITVYSTVTHDKTNQKTIIQYWLFYFYNDWFNKHEGDWELVQIILAEEQNPEWVILSQHHGGTRREWRDTKVEEDTHPAVYVALGSHANYFWGNEIYPNGIDIGTRRVEILDRTGDSDRIIPNIILLPSAEDITSATEVFGSLIWLLFSGNWGELALQGDFGGPTGPSAKGLLWDQPYQWGMDQPLDSHIWYQNRLKLITDESLKTEFNILEPRLVDAEKIDIGRHHLIFHDDPPKEILVEINLSSTLATTLSASWPQKPNNGVEKFSFSDFGNLSEEKLLTNFSENSRNEFILNGEVILPSSQFTQNVDWETPDLIWVAGYLPASEISRGILIILAASVIPTLLYVYLIYQFDRYEKEPLGLLLTAFLWGAFPSVIISLVVQVFFNLPPELVGPKALEAIQLGFISPFIEEAAKGAVILFIVKKHKNEFTDILDGIIYGAVVGLGFAMTGNFISYISSFIVRGFEGLGLLFLVEGVLSGINHAFYSSIFGVGVAYFHTTKGKKSDQWILVGAYLTAVFVNSLHSLLQSSILNWPVLGIILNWMGIITIFMVMVSAIKREQDTIIQYLSSVLPNRSVKVLADSKERRRAMKNAKTIKGRKLKSVLAEEFELLTELAFAKKKLAELGEPQVNSWIEGLTNRINQLEKETGFIGANLNLSRDDSD